nr:2,3-bisphosphoglycerate-independent phosphoglycerate mutase [Chloroflexia bacterium]
LNLGAGFIVYQWITRIDKAIADGTIATNVAIQGAFRKAIANGGTLHLMGLVSDGGVHSHTRHLLSLIDAAKAAGVADLVVHAFTDGRDTSPTSGAGELAVVQARMDERGLGRFATISGRYYAMDRDHRWERTSAAFHAIVHGKGHRADDATSAVTSAYERGRTDEFIEPLVLPDSVGGLTQLKSPDVVIFFNFRSDRGRQLTEALSVTDFAHFDRGDYEPPAMIVTLTTYDATLPVEVAFPPHDVEVPLAKAISDAGMTQLHTAETEKYAHVTFFLNGGREAPFPGEDRLLVPSPKVATYDLQPEMSAFAVRLGVVVSIAAGTHDFIIVNFANCDMVGHTGVFDAAVRAVETVDGCLGTILEALRSADGTALVTADHGNAEVMIDLVSGGPFTAHTTNPVPVVLVAPDDHPLRHAALRTDGVLSAVAPTILQLLGITPPIDMTQASLIER